MFRGKFLAAIMTSCLAPFAQIIISYGVGAAAVTSHPMFGGQNDVLVSMFLGVGVCIRHDCCL